MEGVQSNPTGLIQVRMRGGPIYLFRTGYNPRLLHEGRIKELLQSADVLKVMHASTSDCIGIGEAGVRTPPKSSRRPWAERRTATES